MAVPSFRAWTYAELSGSSSTCPKPTGLTVGDLMVLYVSANGGPGTVTPPSGFTLAASIAGTDFAYTKIADSGDVAASNFTISWTGYVDPGRAILGAFYQGSDVLELVSLTTAQNDGQAYNLTSSSRTAFGSDCLAFMVGNGLEQTGGDGFPSVTGGGLTWSYINMVRAGSAKACGMAYAADSGGTGSGTWTMATNASCTNRRVIAGVIAVAKIPSIATLGAVQVGGSGGSRFEYTETIDGDYTVWKFGSVGSGLLSLPDGWQSWMRARALVVAGGGGGSAPGDAMHGTGGGGAGGYLYEAEFELTENMTIAVGAGGAVSQHGDDSILGSLHAYGGGAAQNYNAGDGGSSGGMNCYSQSEGGQWVGTPVSGQGHYGGSAGNISAGETGGGGGGGGAGSAAGAGNTHYHAGSTGGAGGSGLANDITGSSLTYAVGGKGGDMAYGGGSPSNGAAGTNGRGNGGSGGDNAGSSAGAGGNGVVIIRFLTPTNAGEVTLGSPRATGAGHVDAAYPAVGTATLGAVQATGQGRTPIWGSGRAEVGPTQIPLGRSADTVYMHCDATLLVAPDVSFAIRSVGCNVIVSVASEDYSRLSISQVAELIAAGVVHVAPGTSRLSYTGAPVLPPTDDQGWTASDQHLTPLQTELSITIAGNRVNINRIEDLTIELSDRGGYDSATLILVRDPRKAPNRLMAEMKVWYKGHLLFRGRLESRGPSLGDDTTETLVFTGPIIEFSDHQGFRRVYADSDTANWQTGQGPNTSANVFDVEGS